MQKRYFMILSYKSTLFLILLCFTYLVAISQENPEDYGKTIEMADNYFAKGDYINAKASYQIAVKMAPEDQYARDRLQQTLNMIKVQMQQNALYAEKILVADELYKKNDWEGAIVFYKSALEFLPGDTYANGRIQEIEKSFADKRKKEEDYQASLIAGDQFLKVGNLAASLAEYKKATDLKPDENFPVEKIAEIEQLLAEQKQVAGSYEKAMADAELAIQRQKYDEAIMQLEAAVRIKPDENYPKEKLAEARQLKSLYESYSSIIESADNYYIEKDFEKARTEYQKALAIKPGDEYPQSMLDKIEVALMDISRANRSSYELAIAEADKLFNQQDYEQAMVEYKNALRFKPDEDYAKQRIGDINNMLALIKSQDEAYAQSISRADQLFKDQLYEESKEEYNRAIGFRPMEQYPKVKIDEIRTILANLQSQRQIYSSLIAGADKLFFADDYVEAREQYRKASDLFPKEQYPLDQIKMINEILGQRDKYIKAITDADRLLYEKKYEEALSEYRKAAALDENEVYAEGRIYEIETKIAEEQILQAQQRMYDSALVVADDLFTAGDYIRAMESYKAAQAILPGEGYPKRKMEEINRIADEKNRLAALEKEYTEKIESADSLLVAKNYKAAKNAYEEALKLNPSDAYPSVKLDEIKKIQEEIAIREAQDKRYSDLISGADLFMAAGDYPDARKTYEEASAIKPGEDYPRMMIQEAEKLMGEIAAKEALEKQYAEALANADKLFEAKDYQNALLAYQSARSLKPEEQYPAVKIAQVNTVLGEISAQAELDKQFAEAVAKADELFEAGDFNGSLAVYRSAQALKPAEKYPADQMALANAKLDEIAARQALDKQYAEAISKADKLLADKDYKSALSTYQEAAALKPSENYPDDKILEINRILEEIAVQDAMDKQYAEAIVKADNLFQNRNYSGALATYKSALELKPEEKYPGDKMAEINALFEKQYADKIVGADKLLAVKDYQNALIAYQEAAALKPSDSYPAGKIAEINKTLETIAAQEALDKQYAERIVHADKLFESKDYSGAIAAYESAQALKPSEKYPGDKISAAKAELDKIAAKDALDKQYSQLIAEAEVLTGQQNYTEARKKYEAAKTLKPLETSPTVKIQEIDAILAEQARLAQMEKNYSDAIAFGDKHFAAKDYANARSEYQKALDIKSEEAYPTQKLAEIDAIEAEARKQKEIDTQYNKAIAEADEFFRKEQLEEARFAYQEAQKIKPDQSYPQQQVIDINRRLEYQAQEREQAYSIALSKADNYFEQQDWEMARIQYERATEIKPNEVYPLDKLKLVNQEIMKKRQVIQAEYDKSIADADKFYASKLYDNAIDSYRASSLLKPDEEYPKEMVRRILKMLSERSIVQINKDPLLIPNNTQHKFDFFSVPVKDRKSNYIYFTARNASVKDYKLIINFGKDQAKNGGFVVKVPAGSDINEYIVRISAQYKWFSDDNNWITFYPEGGDIEVSLLQISYSD